MSNSYNFPAISFRARCLEVIDDNTVDLYIDMGFHTYHQKRFQLAEIDILGLQGTAKEEMIEILRPGETNTEWPLRVIPVPSLYPDDYYLIRIYIWYPDEDCELCVNDFMVETGHAEYINR